MITMSSSYEPTSATAGHYSTSRPVAKLVGEEIDLRLARDKRTSEHNNLFTDRRPDLRPLGPGTRRPRPAPPLTPRRYQSLVNLAQGVVTRTRCAPKSMTRAVSSSTLTTRPRPYLS